MKSDSGALKVRSLPRTPSSGDGGVRVVRVPELERLLADGQQMHRGRELDATKQRQIRYYWQRGLAASAFARALGVCVNSVYKYGRDA